LFCLTLLLEIANSAGYLKTSNLSLTNWNAAVQKQATGIANSLIQCASLCQHTEDFVPSGTCNAFKYEGSDSKCTLANIGFLEDVQPNIESQVRAQRKTAISAFPLYICIYCILSGQQKQIDSIPHILKLM
jgi:hypothetical protein